MKFLMLSIEGLFSYKEKSSLTLDKPGLILVNGEIDNDADDSNGAGKTSILDTICLCLFKTTTRGTDGDDVVNDDMNSGWASLTFISGNEAYQAQYERDKKLRRTTWRIYQIVDGSLINISGKTQSETSQIIQAITGIDYKAFSNSVLFGQGSVSLFLSKEATDADRKRLFTQILDLDVLDGALKETRESISDINKKMTEVQALIDSHNEVIAGEKEVKAEKEYIDDALADVRGDIEAVDKDLAAIKHVEVFLQRKRNADSREEDLVKTLSSIRKDKDRADQDKAKGITDCKREEVTAKTQLEEIEKESSSLEQIEESLKKIESADCEKEKIDKEISALDQEIATASSKVTEKKKKIKSLEEMKKKIADCKEDDQCPYCAQGLDDASRKSINLKVDSEINDVTDEIEDINFAKNNLLGQRDSLQRKIEHVLALLANNAKTTLIQRQQRIKTRIEGKGVWEEQLKRLEVKKKEIAERHTSWLEDLETRKTETEKSLGVIRNEKAEIDDRLKGAYIPEKSKETLEEEHVLLFQNRDDLIIRLGENKQAMTAITKSKSTVSASKKVLTEYAQELKYEKFLEEMFGPDGIKSLIITSVTPRLTDLANKYLEILSDEQISIEFVTSYEGKTTTIEDFKILVTRGLRTSDIRSFSGG